MTATDNATLLFARQILEIGRGGLSAADQEQLRRLLLDCLGVSRIGGTLSWTEALIGWAGRFAGSGAAPVVGTDLMVAPSIAALINGTAAHGYELDDTHDASMSHPGAVVIPAALAVAAELGSSAEDTMAAIACGYEAMARVGMAADAGEVIHRGFHPTALFGGFGSAAATARLLGLDEHGLARAWGHILSLSAGSMQFSDEPEGTTVKRLHAGYAAQNGVMAAELAARGIGAPARAIDGKYGFLALYSRKPKLDQLRIPAGAPLQIHVVSFKPYSCCRLFHSLIDGLREVSDDFSLKPENIARIDVRGPGVIFEQHMLRRPTSVMAAQYSLPFVVGATLAYGPHRYDSYREDKLTDPAILHLADRVEGEQDLEIEAHYPAHMGTSVEILRTDGTRRSAKVMDSRGTAANPLSTDALYGKAEGLVREVAPRVDLAAARTALWGNPAGRDMARLFAAV
ncbi:MmgE/PrpD family protein [Enterovirga sp.]|uniref:MmgE/PrpD family protein n=1 Tax=Enterovirga sp. TaxID=2026350 RepID=UPI00261AFB88|nr:MmgE/PrpD family protein [Enterovirga sp.]MDB5592983.1 MmgE/PrpD [Enterovirga sp.]